MSPDQNLKADIETLLNVSKPKLIEAYRNADAKSYHATCGEYFPVAHRVFMSLIENSNITWFAFEAFGSSLCNPFFWKYTDLIQSFCEYLELINKKGIYAAHA